MNMCIKNKRVKFSRLAGRRFGCVWGGEGGGHQGIHLHSQIVSPAHLCGIAHVLVEQINTDQLNTIKRLECTFIISAKPAEIVEFSANCSAAAQNIKMG